jgi:antitoxin component of MazEF toxin-antitoxin module
MEKRLTRTGNSLALVLDKPLLEATGIDGDTPLEISTDGDVIVITPVRNSRHAAKVRLATQEVLDRYAGVFERLADS